MTLVDARNRPLRDLRISVTDRCNFRCTYCMPREHFGPQHPFLPRDELLTYEEMTFVTASLLPLGLEKIRLTGGEPLLRKNITTLMNNYEGWTHPSTSLLPPTGLSFLIMQHLSKKRDSTV